MALKEIQARMRIAQRLAQRVQLRGKNAFAQFLYWTWLREDTPWTHEEFMRVFSIDKSELATFVFLLRSLQLNENIE